MAADAKQCMSALAPLLSYASPQASQPLSDLQKLRNASVLVCASAALANATNAPAFARRIAADDKALAALVAAVASVPVPDSTSGDVCGLPTRVQRLYHTAWAYLLGTLRNVILHHAGSALDGLYHSMGPRVVTHLASLLQHAAAARKLMEQRNPVHAPVALTSPFIDPSSAGAALTNPDASADNPPECSQAAEPLGKPQPQAEPENAAEVLGALDSLAAERVSLAGAAAGVLTQLVSHAAARAAEGPKSPAAQAMQVLRDAMAPMLHNLTLLLELAEESQAQEYEVAAAHATAALWVLCTNPSGPPWMRMLCQEAHTMQALRNLVDHATTSPASPSSPSERFAPARLVAGTLLGQLTLSRGVLDPASAAPAASEAGVVLALMDVLPILADVHEPGALDSADDVPNLAKLVAEARRNALRAVAIQGDLALTLGLQAAGALAHAVTSESACAILAERPGALDAIAVLLSSSLPEVRVAAAMTLCTFTLHANVHCRVVVESEACLHLILASIPHLDCLSQAYVLTALANLAARLPASHIKMLPHLEGIVQDIADSYAAITADAAESANPAPANPEGPTPTSKRALAKDSPAQKQAASKPDTYARHAPAAHAFSADGGAAERPDAGPSVTATVISSALKWTRRSFGKGATQASRADAACREGGDDRAIVILASGLTLLQNLSASFTAATALLACPHLAQLLDCACGLIFNAVLRSQPPARTSDPAPPAPQRTPTRKPRPNRTHTANEPSKGSAQARGAAPERGSAGEQGEGVQALMAGFVWLIINVTDSWPACKQLQRPGIAEALLGIATLEGAGPALVHGALVALCNLVARASVQEAGKAAAEMAPKAGRVPPRAALDPGACAAMDAAFGHCLHGDDTVLDEHAQSSEGVGAAEEEVSESSLTSELVTLLSEWSDQLVRLTRESRSRVSHAAAWLLERASEVHSETPRCAERGCG